MASPSASYNMMLLRSELALLFSRALVVESAAGDVKSAGFVQATHMGGVENGQLSLISKQGTLT